MALAPQHTFQVLTKRPKRMFDYCLTLGRHRSVDRVSLSSIEFDPNGIFYYEIEKISHGWFLPNVWLGVSVENDATAHQRIPLLLQTPAAKRFISAEPLLESLSLRCISWVSDRGFVDALTGETQHAETRARDPFRYPATNPLDWVIAGGESGPHARPMHPDWPRTLRDQCAAAGVPFFFKQWGEWLPGKWSDEETDGALFYPASGGPSPKLSPQSAWADRVHWFDAEIAPCGPGTIRIGKKSAGAKLDGIEHKAFPA